MIIRRDLLRNWTEDYGIALAKWFVHRHPTVVTTVDVTITEHLWLRAVVGGQPHHHAFVAQGPEVRTAEVHMNKDTGLLRVTSGIRFFFFFLNFTN